MTIARLAQIYDAQSETAPDAAPFAIFTAILLSLEASPRGIFPAKYRRPLAGFPLSIYGDL